MRSSFIGIINHANHRIKLGYKDIRAVSRETLWSFFEWGFLCPFLRPTRFPAEKGRWQMLGFNLYSYFHLTFNWKFIFAELYSCGDAIRVDVIETNFALHVIFVFGAKITHQELTDRFERRKDGNLFLTYRRSLTGFDSNFLEMHM